MTSSLTPTQWHILESYVYDGGRLWIVAGPLMSGPAYTTADAQRLMPLALESHEALAGAMGWQLGGDVHPMLQPFTTGENPPLSSVRCYRRMGVATGPVVRGVQIILKYSDSVPAIAARKVGRGTVLFWNFSPERGYSNLGGLKQYAILPILARRAARVLVGQAQLETMYLLGSSITAPLPRGMAVASVTVSKAADAPQALAVDLRQRSVTFTPPSEGSWDLVFARADARLRQGFSVNTDHAESDMTPAKMLSLREMFPEDQLTVADNLEDLQSPQAEVTASLDLAIPILLTLLALMIGESYFANRFYRRSSGDDGNGDDQRRFNAEAAEKDRN